MATDKELEPVAAEVALTPSALCRQASFVPKQCCGAGGDRRTPVAWLASVPMHLSGLTSTPR
jgi:hypothetical protein